MPDWKRCSEAEEWRQVDQFPAYEVSSTGLVRRRGRVLKPFETYQGYLTVVLRRGPERKTARIHRLVAMAFVQQSEPSKSVVNHLDGNRQNNDASNLEWCTNDENIRHAAERGSLARGEKNGASKLTRDDVIAIRRLAAEGWSQFMIAKAFGIRRYTVSEIHRRIYWKHVS